MIKNGENNNKSDKRRENKSFKRRGFQANKIKRQLSFISDGELIKKEKTFQEIQFERP